ncbi:hypothetical protein LOD99_1536 [Oopsacas minuta]|uniref:Uncharacterized protein n=1 Tax=Oopsacas minuta TaxID=111878 RepID=A0AAV7K4N2_9METZ|nr:hypothetical protein LOD99_1536 [Oopsacas minuta]
MCFCPELIDELGIRPKALDLVKDQDLYSIIVSCTERDKNDRVTIPTLLNNELFQEQEIHMEVPHLLSKANTDSSVVCAQEIVRMIDKYSMAKFLTCWDTEDESLAFSNPHLTKAENKAWLATDQKGPRVVRPQPTNREALISLAVTADWKFSVALLPP